MEKTEDELFLDMLGEQRSQQYRSAAGSKEAVRAAGSAPRLLHVTDVLPGRETLQFVPQSAFERGKWVHRACEMDDNGTPLPDDENPQWRGYVEAWRKCREELGVQIVRNEQRVGGPELGWTGTLDRVVTLGEKGYQPEIWDLKTGPPDVKHGLQLAAYDQGYRYSTHGKRWAAHKPLKRRTAHLRIDGTYEVIEHAGKDDLRTFLAFLTVAYYEINHGLREWPWLREDEIEEELGHGD